MDTDVEMLKNIDIFLANPAFTGYERRGVLTTALIGAKKSNEWIGILKKHYNEKNFLNKNGSYNLEPNNTMVTILTKQHYSIKVNNINKYQKINNVMTIYPSMYFAVVDLETRKRIITPKTYTVHHCEGSWLDKKMEIKSF